MEATVTKDYWQLLEEGTERGVEAVSDLFHWSTNYDAGKGPATLFLDLIGYSQEEFGAAIYGQDFETGLGYVELGKLAAALTEYADDPHTVKAFVAELMEAESNL